MRIYGIRQSRGHSKQRPVLFTRLALPIALALVLSMIGAGGLSSQHAYAASPANQAFDKSSKEFGVPVALLKAICYMEGRLSNHGGSPSTDDGYGCMHLVKNSHSDTLDHAAKELGVNVQQLKLDMSISIRGGAAILRDDALQLSSTHRLPTALSDWYGVVAAYSNARTRSTAQLYANNVYKLLNSGFNARTESGELITLPPQAVKPHTGTLSTTILPNDTTLPAKCTNDGLTEYPGAIDCILPTSYDCIPAPDNAPCNYDSADRPNDLALTHVVIHDIEGTALNALNVFQDPKNSVSIHYIVDSDGTVYQVLHEKDIAFHAGNFWYNQHSIGIEHAGFDATGFLWYNATQYLASAQLTAYLLQKYNIPLDHDHIVSHGTIPSAIKISPPNHVDPGPYWLWDYYLHLINEQGVPFPDKVPTQHVITLRPETDREPLGDGGRETPANFNFFYLYNGPSTASGLIPQEGTGSDVTDVTNNVEPAVSYYYLTRVEDPAGSGDTLYEMWYGEEGHAHDTKKPTFLANATLVWLAVPPHTVVKDHLLGQGVLVSLSTADGSTPQISSRPVTDSKYLIGDAPNGAVFVSAYTATEDKTNNLWYEINYNHRQAWVPASEATVVQGQAWSHWTRP